MKTEITRNNVNLLKILRCPACEDERIDIVNEKFQCLACGEKYRLLNNIPVIVDKSFSFEIINNLKNNMSWEDYDSDGITKKIAEYSTNKKSIYQYITPSHRVQVGPTYESFLDTYNISGNVLELGGGPNSLQIPGVVNCDINSYKTVDIIGDARKLPFKDGVFKGIICNSVLEHIFEVEKVVDECFRVLDKGGYIFMCVPQVCGRHHTVDYFRWTVPGLKRQFSKFSIIKQGVILGPAMFVSHIVVSLFRSLTPFKFVNSTICFILEWLFFPLRFLDILGKGNRDYEDYAHTIYIIGKK